MTTQTDDVLERAPHAIGRTDSPGLSTAHANFKLSLPALGVFVSAILAGGVMTTHQKS